MTLAAALRDDRTERFDDAARAWVTRLEVRVAGVDHVVYGQGESREDAHASLDDAVDLLRSTRGAWGAS